MLNKRELYCEWEVNGKLTKKEKSLTVETEMTVEFDNQRIGIGGRNEYTKAGIK